MFKVENTSDKKDLGFLNDKEKSKENFISVSVSDKNKK